MRDKAPVLCWWRPVIADPGWMTSALMWLSAAREFEGVDDVGALGLGGGAHGPVVLLGHQVVELAYRPPGGVGADADHAWCGRAVHGRPDLGVEGKVTEVVGADGHLQAVARGLSLRQVHHAGVVEQEIDRFGLGDPCVGAPDREGHFGVGSRQCVEWRSKGLRKRAAMGRSSVETQVEVRLIDR